MNVRRKWVAECPCGQLGVGAQSFTQQQFEGSLMKNGWGRTSKQDMVCPDCIARIMKQGAPNGPG